MYNSIVTLFKSYGVNVETILSSQGNKVPTTQKYNIITRRRDMVILTDICDLSDRYGVFKETWLWVWDFYVNKEKYNLISFKLSYAARHSSSNAYISILTKPFLLFKLIL